MRKVLFKRWVPREWETKEGTECVQQQKPGTNCWEPEYKNEGLFHSWGFQSTDNGEQMTMDSVGIIELPDGTIEQVYPFNIKFI